MDESIIISMRNHLQRLRRDVHQKVYAPLAESYLRSGLAEDAEQTAQDGLNLFPTYLLCREVLGKLYLKQGKLDQAKEQLERVAKIIKDNQELSRLLGKLYLQLGMDEEARGHFEYVLEKDPFDFEARNHIVQIDRKVYYDEQEEEEDLPDNVEKFPAVPADTGDQWDIENIISSMEEPEVLDQSRYSEATDSTLDALEDFESEIDAKADELFDQLTQEQAPRPIRVERGLGYKDGRKEIQAAAMIGQIHMELHLLDEAMILAKRLLDTEPEDPDLQLILSKFENALETKEAELDRLEEMSLARGL